MSSLVFLMLLEAAAATQEAPLEPPATPHAIRMRGGIEGGPALVHSPERYTLAGGELVGRIGLQLHPMVALVYQGGLAFYGGNADFGDIGESPSYFAVQSAPMVLVTPVDFFELGAGPAVDAVIEHEDFDTGVAVGADARLAFHIPVGPQDERRFGVAIAFDFRPMNLFREINPDFWLLHFQLGAGVEWY